LPLQIFIINFITIKIINFFTLKLKIKSLYNYIIIILYLKKIKKKIIKKLNFIKSFTQLIITLIKLISLKNKRFIILLTLLNLNLHYQIIIYITNYLKTT